MRSGDDLRCESPARRSHHGQRREAAEVFPVRATRQQRCWHAEQLAEGWFQANMIRLRSALEYSVQICRHERLVCPNRFDTAISAKRKMCRKLPKATLGNVSVDTVFPPNGRALVNFFRLVF